MKQFILYWNTGEAIMDSAYSDKAAAIKAAQAILQENDYNKFINGDDYIIVNEVIEKPVVKVELLRVPHSVEL